MPEALKYLIDAFVGFMLLLALVVVFLVDRFFLGQNAAPSANTLTNVIANEPDKKKSTKRLKLAVTPTGKFVVKLKEEKWDDMSKLLGELGEGYKHDMITMDDAVNPKKLAQYDVVFLTCADGKEKELKGPLLDYVSNGGMLYASDWRYEAVAEAFPDMVVAALKNDGDKGELDAEIVDPGLRDALKMDKIHLKFDLPEWKAAAFGGPRVETLMRGTYAKYKGGGQRVTAPLMVKFKVDKGTVIFTSFHNEKQNNEDEKKLLQYLVYSLVTADMDSKISGEMQKGGFTPQRSNLLSTPANQTTEPRKYNNAKESTLRFVLGFRNEGAKLRFKIVAPDGKHFTQDCESTLIVEVPNAVAGDWTYTVTALSLPHPNFPFTVTVGEKK